MITRKIECGCNKTVDRTLCNLACWLVLAACFYPVITIAQVRRHSVLITELYPDPDEKQLIPNAEFLELKNVSQESIDLRGWSITDGASNGIINSTLVLMPDSTVVITSNASAPLFRAFTTTVGVSSFPTLNNDKDEISLLGPSKELVHHVGYRLNWYGNAVKAAGGWTLEMIDTKNPCNEDDNWKASNDPRGGTPGLKNSVDAVNPDTRAPDLIRTYMKDSVTLTAVFSESLDSLTASDKRNYLIDGSGVTVLSATIVSPSLKEVELRLSAPFQIDGVYQLLVNDIQDCSGNSIGMMNYAKCAWPMSAEAGDIVFNELLFNPAGSGYDYTELINRSTRTIDMKNLLVAGKDATGVLNNLSPLSHQNRLMFPGDYVVLTENPPWLRQNYLVKDPSAVIELSDLPSLPDDKGYIALLNNHGLLINDISYSEKWHYALINNKDGVALERIDYMTPGSAGSDWTSAASVAGFGTPGYQNSQYRSDLQAQGEFTITPALFSPDNDGYKDVATIAYTMPEAGYMANISIYNAGGHAVKFLARSELLGIKGGFNWNGLNEKSERLPTGVYVVLMEIFDLKGRTKKFKKAITLARKF